MKETTIKVTPFYIYVIQNTLQKRPPEYLCYDPFLPMTGWTQHYQRALQFARRQDAVKMICLMGTMFGHDTSHYKPKRQLK